ncbi:putative ATP-grasp-modified RiPP [Streptomyces capitiformicae]
MQDHSGGTHAAGQVVEMGKHRTSRTTGTASR